jgi:hypothetical protein
VRPPIVEGPESIQTIHNVTQSILHKTAGEIVLGNN